MPTFITLQSELDRYGLRCVNVIKGNYDLYYIGKSEWKDFKIEVSGYIQIFPHNENDYTRYSVMIGKLNGIKHLF